MAERYFLLNNTPRRTSLKRERNFRISDLTEEEVIKEFRLKKSEIGYICSLLQDSMSPLGFRSTDLLLEQKVLICLKTLGSGSFQNCSKDFINVSQPTVSQVFSDFTDNMVRMAPNFIYMPSNSNEILRTKKEFSRSNWLHRRVVHSHHSASSRRVCLRKPQEISFSQHSSDLRCLSRVS